MIVLYFIIFCSFYLIKFLTKKFVSQKIHKRVKSQTLDRRKKDTGRNIYINTELEADILV